MGVPPVPRLLSLVPALVVMLGAMAASAQEQAPLYCEAVVGSALEHHPRIEEAIAAVSAASGRRISARGAFDPMLELEGRATPVGPYEDYEASAVVSALTPLRGLRVEAGYRYHSGEVPSYYGYRRTGSAGELSFSASLPLLEGGALDDARYRRAIAEIGAERAALGEDLTRIDVANRAARAWVDWLSAARIVEVREALLEVAQERFRNVERQRELGAASDVAVVEAEANLLGRERSLVEAERTLQQAEVRLGFWLRSEDGEISREIAAGYELPPRALALDENRPIVRPDVVDIRMEREELLLAQTLANQERLPEFNVRAFTYVDVGERIPESERAYVGAGATFSAPLGNRAARGRVAEIESELIGLDAQLQQLEESIDVELRTIAVAFELAQARVELLARQVELLTELERAERRAWELGESTLFVVNLRELARGDAEVSLILAEKELWAAALSDLAARGSTSVCEVLATSGDRD